MIGVIQLAFDEVAAAMDNMSKTQFSYLIRKSKILATDSAGRPKVFLNPNKQVIKIGKAATGLAAILQTSRIKKFIRNTQLLKERHIKTVDIEGTYRCKELDLEIVVYKWIPSITLREYVMRHGVSVLSNFAAYLNHLHNVNVYFRGGHLGNFLIQEKGEFVLIDTSNMKFGVGLRRRAKNLHYIMNYPTDKLFFKQYGKERFINEYMEYARFSNREKRLFKERLKNLGTFSDRLSPLLLTRK